MKKLAILSLLLISSFAFSQDVLMQTGTVTQCSGTFYDSGGVGGNYGSGESFVLTICPDVAGNLIQVDFTAFSTQLNNDVLTIYNGDSTAAPAFGQFSGGGAGATPGFVSATQANTSGCLTFEFVTDASATTTGWEATISCFEPCQTIVSQLDSATPTPNGDGYIRVCPNEDITLNGSGVFSVDGAGATYEWDLGDGNTVAGQSVTFSYATPGVYIVNLDIRDANTDGDPLGCPNTNLINQVVQVATEPDFTGTEAVDSVICFGDSTDINGVVTPTEFINDCTPPVSGVTVLPDQSGATYETSVTVDCYDSTQTLTSVDQIVAVCVNIEHSFSGDLDIFIISPTGLITQLYDQGGGGTYFGGANNLDNQVPGIGAEYCFAANAAVTVNNGGTVIAGSNPPNASWLPGTYLPTGNFNTLLGSPLNGDWTLQLVDNLGVDDGTVFGWSIEFDPALQPPELSFEPVITSEVWDADPSITNTVGNTITVAPATAGTHCYTYRAMDDFGCEYTEQVCIDVLPEVVTAAPNDLFLCNPGAPPYIFDLTQNTPVVLAAATNAGDLNVTYHETQADADADTAAIATPANYSSSAVIGSPQTIYVRVEYLASGCYETETFTLNITSQPIINTPLDMVLCDVGNDGTEPFNLDSQTPAVLGTQSAASYTVTYYTSLADAASGTGALVSNYNNVSNPEPIFVRIELNGDPTCFNVTANPLGEFDLILNPTDDASFLATPTCDGAIVSNVAAPGGTFAFNPVPTDGAVIDLAGNVTGGTSGASYTIEYTTAGICPETSTQTFTVLTVDDPSFTTTSTCDGGTVTITGDTGGVFAFNPAPTDAAIIDAATGTITMGTSGATYTIEYTTAGVCPDSSTQTVTVFDAEDASFTTTPTCDGGTVTIIGDAGGTFVFNPAPIDTATIDAATGTITNGVFGTTYTIEYTTSGPCPETTTQTVTVLDSDDASFTITPTCDGGTIVVNGTLGGLFAFNPVPTDTAVIDPATGEVTGGTSGAMYTIEYTTSGICSDTLTQVLNVLPADDSSFTLTPTCDGATALATVPGGSYAFNPVPTDGAVIDSVTGTITLGVSGTAYTVEYTSNGTCVTTTPETVTVFPQPVAIAPTPLAVCDDNTPDGFTSIDLTIKNTEISGGNPDYAVTYYFTVADAIAEMNPLPNMYTNMSNPQTVYIRVEDINTGCYDATQSMVLQVEQAPIAFTPTPLEYCDPDSDGFGVFTLTDADLQITGGAPGLTVTYHETMADADNNVNMQTSPYNNIVMDMQTIYVRIESATIATNCASFVELVLIVNDTPQITPPAVLTPLEVCDDNADGFATFDLPTKDTEILNGLDPALYTVNYYETLANAQAPVNAILSPNVYVNTMANMQTLWVRVDDTVNGCSTITELVLIVNPLPVLVQPDPIELCDDNNTGDEIELFDLEDANAQILNGQNGISLTYYSTQLGADTAIAADEIFSPYANTSNPQTVYVRAENNVTGCISTITLDLRVNPLPSPVVMPLALEQCDDDNDGFVNTFDLDSQTLAIVNGEAGVTITYYETQANAESATSPLMSPYTNIVANAQTIYVRAENTGTPGNPATGCFTIVELPLVVLPSPVVPIAIDDYVVCDDDNDEFNQFDFDTVITPQVYGTQNVADFNLSYHVTLADAQTGNNPIANTGNYTNMSNPQTIYIRLVSVANGCVTTGEFDIRVALPPVLEPGYDNELSQCDDLDADYMEANDGTTSFDLTVEDIEITGPANVSWIVTYYELQADAIAGINEIPDPTAYTNTMIGPQTLHVRVTDNDTGCFSFTTVTIRVLPNPSPSPNPDDLVLCDDVDIVGPNDLIEVFDLTQNEAFIINGEVGVTASYYLDQNDAITGTNAIVDPTLHTNEDPNTAGASISPQTIYVRLTNGDDTTGLNGTGCYSLVSFDVIVNPLPVVTPVDDYIYCELFNDGFYDFDLESMTPAILNGQSATDFTVTYHENLLDAQTAMNALSSPYTNMTNPQEIFVNITNTITGCDVATLSFNIEVQEAAQANPDGVAIVYELCDDNMEFDNDPTNDSVQFDLASQNPFVLDGQDVTNYTVTYYDNQADADAFTNPLPFLYENTVNPQVIYVRVDNDTMIVDPTDPTNMIDSSICYETAEITLQVNPMPSFDLDDTYLLCVNTNGSEVISSPLVDTGLLLADGYSFVWFLEGVEQTQFNNQPSIMPTVGGNYTVVVTSALGCSTLATDPNTQTLVQVSEPPALSASITTLAFADQHDIQVTATSSATGTIAEYEFSLDGGSFEANTPNNDMYTFSDVAAGEHTITVRDINGCGEASITVIVMDYPLYFTPNGDGYHDTWNIYALDNQPDAKLYIYDRYGKLLKQLSPTGDGWDGTYNGKLMPTSDYWFTLDYREPNTDEKKTFKAHFTLKR